MSLFQKSVEKKYLNELDSVLIDKKFKEFQGYFGNPVIQDNIRNSKEEQYQEGFLRELFVSILGYTLNPHPNFNLTTELKNIANSKKADGAILKGEDAIAVIELKGTDTTDLDKIETQAFGYKNHHPKCVYVITSNFEKLRFYIQNAVDHIDFDLFKLSREQFSLMWLCLAKENLLNGLALKIKESSLLQEENITKKLYADYSKFREAIYNNLIKNNPETDKLLLFKKTQKLLDRFLFVFFAEDRLLLPPNSISEIVKQWKTLRDELDEYVPLYDRFKKYFRYMNTGYKGKKYDIYAYNGGLFATDEILDNISIDDEILHYHTLTLSQYDFETDVDVNILGHIFEHSLGEIENVQAEIKGEKIDNQKTKRKKDGIFYTPKYITKYIVENTIGKLCEEKRISLDIVDEEYAKERKNRKREAIKELDDKLTEYRNWLLTLTILDPACGSGAFLNQALDFLINEHRKIDELRAQLFGGGLVFSDITSDILENNIYGVDINEESVEIAKLSLWLRTAQKGRKLNSLSNNIKCGNSLIDDPEVAGDKAFNWQNEFPDIFKDKEIHEEFHAYHVTWATYNSRPVGINNIASPIIIDDDSRNQIAEYLDEKIRKENYRITAINILKDHIHCIVVCTEKELSKIVGQLKGFSSHQYHKFTDNINHRVNPMVDEVQYSDGTLKKLWAKDFSHTFLYDDTHFTNAMHYIENNHLKHQQKQLEYKFRNLTPLEDAFKPRFEKGGFDVVIGNPPYGAELSPEHKTFLEKKFDTFEYQVNTYVLFYERGLSITTMNGMLGYITPATFTYQHYFKKLRQYMQQYSQIAISKYFYEVFDDADIGDSVSWIMQKNKNSKTAILTQLCKTKEDAMDFPILESYASIVNENDNSYKLSLGGIDISKFDTKSKPLVEIAEIIVGIKAYQTGKGVPKQTREIVNNKIFTTYKKVDETYMQCVIGRDFHRYRFLQEPTMFLSYGKWLAEPRESAPFFDDEKIILRQTSDSLIGHIDNKKRINLNNVYNIGKKDSNFDIKYILSLLNSRLLNYIYQIISQEKGRTFAEVKKIYLAKLPIRVCEVDLQKKFADLVDSIIKRNENFSSLSSNFISLVTSKFSIEKPTGSLINWFELNFNDFLKELQKVKIKLSLSEEAEWMQYFNEQKAIAQALQSEIEKTDKEIDLMVYQLYELTEDEIRIVTNQTIG